MDLFRKVPVAQPLAARLRAASLDEYVGQEHLLARGKPLREALEQGALHSMIFWGPPGVGKTTLARLLAQVSDAHFETISALLLNHVRIFGDIEGEQAVIQRLIHLHPKEQDIGALTDAVDQLHIVEHLVAKRQA